MKYLEPLPKAGDKSVQSYLAGFGISIALTTAAFMLVWAYQASSRELYNRTVMITALTILAVVQLVVQSLFFLHVSAERKARFNLYSGIFTAIVVLIIVVGSVWVMQNLNYNMMPQTAPGHVQLQEGLKTQ